jgi:amino acid transporter
MIALILIGISFIPMLVGVIKHGKKATQHVPWASIIFKVVGFTFLVAAFSINEIKWEFAFITAFQLLVMLVFLITKICNRDKITDFFTIQKNADVKEDVGFMSNFTW